MQIAPHNHRSVLSRSRGELMSRHTRSNFSARWNCGDAHDTRSNGEIATTDRNCLFTPKPLPKTGSLQELAEGLIWSFQQWTPPEREGFRREIAEDMQRTYRELAATVWEEENLDRGYEKELKN
jgi:hypothetical protein